MDAKDYLNIISPASAALAPHNGLSDPLALAGVRQRTTWIENALSVPMLVPLTGFVMRAWRESWPDPATDGAAVYDLSKLADYIHGLKGEGE